LLILFCPMLMLLFLMLPPPLQVESLQEVWEDVVVPDEITWESVAAAAQAAQNQQEAGGGAAGGGGGGGDSWEEGSLRNGLVQRPKVGAAWYAGAAVWVLPGSTRVQPHPQHPVVAQSMCAHR
jgi:hypothetical protein